MTSWFSSFLLLIALGWALVLCVYDIRQRRLPDFLTLPAGGLALAWILLTLQWSGLWGLIWPALYLVLAVLSHGHGMGGGDIKLAVPLGIVIAVYAGGFAVMVAIALTAVVAVMWGIGLRWKGHRQALRFSDPPNGPAMLLATGVVIFTPL